MTIITNSRPRELVTYKELPIKWQEYFDYVSEEDAYNPRFVRYKGSYYDVNDMIVAPDCFKKQGWDAYESHTYFSGILVKLVENGEMVIMGRYYF